MRDQEIEVQIGTYCLHIHPAFTKSPQMIHCGSFPGSRYAYDHCLTLPLYHDLSVNEQQAVVDMLKELIA